MYLQRYFIIVGTGFGGAWTMIVGAMALVGDATALAAAAAGDVWVAYPLNPAPGQQWVPIAWMALGVIGTGVQLGFTGGEKGRVGTEERKPVRSRDRFHGTESPRASDGDFGPRQRRSGRLEVRKDTRRDMRKTVAILSVCGFVLSVTYAVLGAQGKASAGVYTAEQAKRGEALYKEQCAACHGDNLEGSGPMPPLAGKDFLTNWHGKSLGDLYEKIQTTMPATAPGTLTPAQTANMLAFMLKAKFPAGSTALEGKVEALLPISIDAPK